MEKDDPVVKALEALETALYDSQYGKGLAKPYLHKVILEKDNACAHYQAILEENRSLKERLHKWEQHVRPKEVPNG